MTKLNNFSNIFAHLQKSIFGGFGKATPGFGKATPGFGKATFTDYYQKFTVASTLIGSVGLWITVFDDYNDLFLAPFVLATGAAAGLMFGLLSPIMVPSLLYMLHKNRKKL